MGGEIEDFAFSFGILRESTAILLPGYLYLFNIICLLWPPYCNTNPMSTETVATLRRMSREELCSLLLSPDASKVAVIDVRDDDHVGGHIIDSIHVPSFTLDLRVPEIIRSLTGREIVVFHCALSQQRGPAAALKYLKERENKIGGEFGKGIGEPGIGIRDGQVQKDPAGRSKEQEVYVLARGFVGWQEKCVSQLLSRA